MDNRKISICIPTYNRPAIAVESFHQLLPYPEVSEIILSDDCSEENIYEELKSRVSSFCAVKTYQNLVNIDCYQNKRQAIGYATNGWAILLDDDNIAAPAYLSKIFSIEKWDERTIYTPDFAHPHFDFREYSGLLITKHNVAEYVDKPMFETLLNACNYFVNVKQYIEIWDGKVDPVTSDSIYMCMKWLEAGNKIQVVPGLQYYHRVWSDSHYQKNVKRTPTGFHQAILQHLKNMK